MGRHYVDEKFGWIIALLYPLSRDILFYFSLLGEIDLFYSMITMASFFGLFHFYQKKQFFLAFAIIYLFGAIGTLTKGLPSFPFTGLTILAYLWYKKDLKRLLSLAHIGGASLFILLIGGYFFIYHFYADLPQFLNELWSQSSDRTVASQGWKDLVVHLFSFPLHTLASMLPASILILFALRKGFFKRVKENELIAFSLLVLAINFLIYWISPGSRQRYIYMLYPLFLLTFSWFFHLFQERNDWRRKFFILISTITLAIFPLFAIAINFIPDLDFLPYLLPLSVGSFAVFIIIFIWKIKKPAWSLPILILGFAFARILFDLAVLPQRAYDSNAQKDKETAGQIMKIIGKKNLSIYKEGRISYTTIHYLNQLREKSLRRSQHLKKDSYYITKQQNLSAGSDHQVLKEFHHDDINYYLIRIEN